METIVKRLAALRRLMAEREVDAWLAPSADPHQSEYVAARWQARAWLSGFSGSAGTLLVKQDWAGLWTDSRYHIRAAQELAGSGIELFKNGLPGVPSHIQWLKMNLDPGACLGFDGGVLSVQQVALLEKALQGGEITFAYQKDLVDEIWFDRPAIPRRSISLLGEEFAGESRAAKLARIREEITKQEAQAALLCALDDIAWTFNLRGADVDYNPVAVSYALVDLEGARLFIDPGKVPQEAAADLLADGVMLAPYEAIVTLWDDLPPETSVLLDRRGTSYKLAQIIAQRCQVKEAPSIPRGLKARKNATELEGLRRAHLRDGAAVVRWFAWLEREIGPGAPTQTGEHTEITLAEQLTRFRSVGEHFQGLSFNPIIAYRANAAIGHYSARPETTPTIRPTGILLADTGGQYLDGTTDITRTTSLDSPSGEAQRVYTAVLKSLIRLSKARFPQGATGAQLDAIAREPLWAQLWQCRHGIGHGVGHYLNVHEGPQGLAATNSVAFEPGMVVTIEPGVYLEGEFGVRLENMVVVVPAGSSSFGEFYAFETLTWCPFDLDLVAVELLDEGEIAWLNDYHRSVVDKLADYLSPEERAWLNHAARPISRM